MFKLARKNYLREIFSGGSSCTGDCGQGRRCTCSGESKEMSRPPETAEKPTDSAAQNPAFCINRLDIIRMAREAGANRSSNPDKWDILEIRDTDLERFAALVAAHFECLPGRKPVQVPVTEFVEMVMEKEHLVGKPLVWAQWPNEEQK